MDRTLTTIPNAALAKMPIVNLTLRDQMLIQTVIGLRYETSPEQLRGVLVKLRELAFPSQTLYRGRDRGSGPIKAKNAEASVEENQRAVAWLRLVALGSTRSPSKLLSLPLGGGNCLGDRTERKNQLQWVVE